MDSGDINVTSTLPIDGVLLADVLLRLRRDDRRVGRALDARRPRTAEIDVHFESDGDAWTFTVGSGTTVGLTVDEIVTPPVVGGRQRRTRSCGRFVHRRPRRDAFDDLARALVDELRRSCSGTQRARGSRPGLRRQDAGSSAVRTSAEDTKREHGKLIVRDSWAACDDSTTIPGAGRPERGTRT